jgi:hypothetical protein
MGARAHAESATAAARWMNRCAALSCSVLCFRDDCTGLCACSLSLSLIFHDQCSFFLPSLTGSQLPLHGPWDLHSKCMLHAPLSLSLSLSISLSHTHERRLEGILRARLTINMPMHVHSYVKLLAGLDFGTLCM